MKKEKSEFGKGCTYCIGLFLMHAERGYFVPEEQKKIFTSHWFNGASDHLYDLEIPEQFSEELKRNIIRFREFALDLGHGAGMCKDDTQEDIDSSLKEAIEILMMIDKEQFGLKPLKGQYE